MNWMIAFPELVLAILGLLILVFGVTRKQDAFVSCTLLTIAALVVAAGFVATAPFAVGSVPTSPLGTGYDGLFVMDSFGVFMKLLILAGSILALVLALDYNKTIDVNRFEFPLLILFCTVGMMVMASASSLMTLYIGLELQSLAIYVLAAFARDTQRSAEAGLKYFVLGALASGLLLYGISLVYGFAGTMDFAHLAASLTNAPSGKPSVGLVIGIVFVVAGLAFKLSAAPFHMWTPDVYEGAPTSVTAFMGTAPKVAAIALLLRALITPFGHLLASWQQLIVLVSIASMVWGALAALGQTSIKRLMAYSSIGHMGYALIGLAVGNAAGVRGVMIYMVTYVFMNAGTFACIIAMRRGGKPLERITDLTGLGRTDPALALMLTIFMFSMAGIPPMSGFFGKLYVFLAAVQGGLWTLAVIGVLTSVIGAYYYLRIIKVMYFDAGGIALDRRTPALNLVAYTGAAITLLFVLFSAPLIGAAQAASRALLG